MAYPTITQSTKQPITSSLRIGIHTPTLRGKYVDLIYEIMHCIGFFIPTISGYATDINYLDIFQFHALTVTVTNA